MSSIVRRRKQVDILNEKMKQAKNLVKESQDELEMKDMWTVKQIEETPKEQSSSCCDQEEAKPEDTKNSEVMTKIEAELKAELERLKLNMKTTTLDSIFEFVEGDPNLWKLGDSPDSDRDNSETCVDQPQTPNFAVSLKELTLDLHEIIESKLGERILNLEAALEGTRGRLSALSLSGSSRRATADELDESHSRSNRRRRVRSAPICSEEVGSMGRGVSYGGGQSSLGYLFGNEEAPKAAPINPQPVPTEAEVMPPPKLVALPDVPKDIPAGIHSSSRNSYMRADGQNTGNILTDRPSTKVHAEPGGGSSLGYLFGGGSK
ncbi:hypothetical protein SAY87_015812 [Trapa incisa]|uniref:Uncharacterized protein n=1 Tax=Trapa incisa TaxID=236973 RepID=A0AAN7LFK2_9MYRT|nr:hypothetical protein SAY87_015812 [Trapa incisa]